VTFTGAAAAATEAVEAGAAVAHPRVVVASAAAAQPADAAHPADAVAAHPPAVVAAAVKRALAAGGGGWCSSASPRCVCGGVSTRCVPHHVCGGVLLAAHSLPSQPGFFIAIRPFRSKYAVCTSCCRIVLELYIALGTASQKTLDSLVQFHLAKATALDLEVSAGCPDQRPPPLSSPKYLTRRWLCVVRV
jgi:hypothetical protein